MLNFSYRFSLTVLHHHDIRDRFWRFHKHGAGFQVGLYRFVTRTKYKIEINDVIYTAYMLYMHIIGAINLIGDIALWRDRRTDMIVHWITRLYYRKLKPFYHLVAKTIWSCITNESTKWVYQNFHALSRIAALGIKRTKYFNPFGGIFL